MNIFLAGGSGAIGVPLVRALVASGHQVTALTRFTANEPMLRALGATPAVADALDAAALRRVVMAARPTHVIHQLTALPKAGPRSARDLAPTNRLRIEGTKNLLAAAINAGAARLIGGSFALMGAEHDGIPAEAQEAADAVRSIESQILQASARGLIEGAVLRYGLFYGADNVMTQQMIALARRRLLPAVRGDRGLLPLIQ
jgi:nucleoside-diphosphate-sugar epimerase